MLINIQQTISRNDFIKILRASEYIGNIGLLVKRHRLKFSDETAFFSKALSPHVIETKDSNKWPGTELLDGFATLIYFKIDVETSKILLNTLNTPHDFKAPNSFEDFCILRDDLSPWFISITHENDFYFNVKQDEVDILYDCKVEVLSDGRGRQC